MEKNRCNKRALNLFCKTTLKVGKTVLITCQPYFYLLFSMSCRSMSTRSIVHHSFRMLWNEIINIVLVAFFCLITLHFQFHRTKGPLLYISQDSTFFVFSFIGLSVLCFMIHMTQRPLFLLSQDSMPFFCFIGLNVLCFQFHRTQRPLFFVSQDSMSFVFCFI